jgi:hypothetical protein
LTFIFPSPDAKHDRFPFRLLFLAPTIAPGRILPVLGLYEPRGFIIRLYGIFQLSWALLFFFALKDVEKNQAIIHSGIITGTLVAVIFVVCHFAGIKSGSYLLLNAALLLVYSLLLVLRKPRPARP